MQFIKNITSRITRNLPFRMAVGRFGILLMKVGRVLQVRYANYNSEVRLKHEIICASHCTLHVSEALIESATLSFDGPTSQPRKITPMVRDLFSIRGVAHITLRPYEVEIRKGNVFSWQELLPSLERVVLEHLTA